MPYSDCLVWQSLRDDPICTVALNRLILVYWREVYRQYGSGSNLVLFISSYIICYSFSLSHSLASNFWCLRRNTHQIILKFSNWHIFLQKVFFWILTEVCNTLHKIYCAKYISWLSEWFSWFQLPDLYFLIYTLAQHLAVVHSLRRYKIRIDLFSRGILIYTRLFWIF